MRLINILLLFTIVLNPFQILNAKDPIAIFREDKTPLIIINGYYVKYSEYLKLKPEYIEKIITLEGEEAIALFGEKAKDGAIVVTLVSKYRGAISSQDKADAEKIALAENISKKKQEEEARLKAEQAKKDEEARLKAEQAKKEEEARLKAEQAKKEEEARLKAEQAKKDEEARLKAEQAKKEEEARLKAELKAKAEQQKQKEEEARKASQEALEKAKKEAEAQKNKANLDMDMSINFRNELQQDFLRSIRNEKVKKVIVDGKEVTKQEALKISIFDVDTSITTYNSDKTEGVLEIRMSKSSRK